MRKELRELVAENCRRLEESDRTLRSVYEVMFRPENAVLAEYDDGFRIQKTTYGQAKARIEEASAALYARVGATHGYVGLEMENSVDWIVAFWAILRSGNKPWLVNTRHPKVLSERIRRDLGVSVVVCDRPGALDADYLPVSELTGGAPFTSEFENEFALATSATSLNEIVCFYTGRQVTAQLLNTRGVLRDSRRVAFHYRGALKQLAFLPFYHIFGLFAVYFWFTYFGRTLVFLRDYSPDTILSTCRRQEVTHIFAVPLLWHTVEKQLLKELDRRGERAKRRFWRGVRLGAAVQQIAPYWGARLARRLMKEVTDSLFGPSVQFCISGGSFLRPSALALFNGMGYPLHNGYGMSEVGITSVELGARPGERNRNAVGRPLDNVEYRLTGEGVLLVKGDAVCEEILVNGERRRTEEWFNTGDRARREPDGRYTLLGRVSDLVITDNGENVDPDRIEEALTLPEAVNFCVLGLGEGAGETLTLIVQTSPYLSGERLRALSERVSAANAALPSAMQLRRVLLTADAIAPPTAIKVGRAWLKRAIDEGAVRLTPLAEAVAAAPAEGTLPPALADKVRGIVADELGLAPEAVGDDADWVTALGMTSLQYYSVAAALCEQFGLSGLPEGQEHTLRATCRWIERNL